MVWRDRFYRLAKEEGYRSRAAYKLKQINNRFSVISQGDVVVDLGAAPGGWLQVAKELSGGRVVGVDLQRIRPIEGVETIRGDMTDPRTIKKIGELVGEADVVLSDAAPNLTGNWSLDHARSVGLAESAFEVAKEILRPGGVFVVKVFQGDMFKDFYDQVGRSFAFHQAHSPEASRKESAETYVVAKGFTRAPVGVGDVLEVVIEDVGREGDGIARVDDYVLFVGGVEVGDRVQVRVVDVKPRFGFAEVVE